MKKIIKTTVKVKNVREVVERGGEHAGETLSSQVVITIVTDRCQAAVFGDFMQIVKPHGEFSELPRLLCDALFVAEVSPEDCELGEMPKKLHQILDLDNMVLAPNKQKAEGEKT